MDQAVEAIIPHSQESKPFLDLPEAALLSVLAACGSVEERALRCTCSTLAAMPKAPNPVYVALKALSYAAEPAKQTSSDIQALLSTYECNGATISFIMCSYSKPESILAQPDLACWMMAYAGKAGDSLSVDWLLKFCCPDQAAALRKKYTTSYDKAWIAAAGHAAGGNHNTLLAALLELPFAPGKPAGRKTLPMQLQTALLLGAVSGPTPSNSLAKIIYLCHLPDDCQGRPRCIDRMHLSESQYSALSQVIPELIQEEMMQAMEDACILATKAGNAQAIPAMVEHGMELSASFTKRVLEQAVEYDQAEVVDSLVHLPLTGGNLETTIEPIYIAIPGIVRCARNTAFERTPLPAVRCMLAIDQLYCDYEETAWVDWYNTVRNRDVKALAALLQVPEYESDFRSQRFCDKADLLGIPASKGDVTMLDLLVEYGALPHPRSLLTAATAYSRQLADLKCRRAAKLACCHRLLELLLVNSDCYQLQRKYLGYKLESPCLTKAERQRLEKQKQSNLHNGIKQAGLLKSGEMLKSLCMMGERHLVKLILSSTTNLAQMFNPDLLGELAMLCSTHCSSRSELLYLAVQKGADILQAVTAAFRKSDVLLLANLLQDIQNHYKGIRADLGAPEEDPFLSFNEFQKRLHDEWNLLHVSEKSSQTANMLANWLAELSVGGLSTIKEPFKMEKAKWALQCLLKDHKWAKPSSAVVLPQSDCKHSSLHSYNLLEWLLNTFGCATVIENHSLPPDEPTFYRAEAFARNAPLPFTVLLANHGADRGQLIRGLAARMNPPMHLIQQLMIGLPASLAKRRVTNFVGQMDEEYQLSDDYWEIAVLGALHNENTRLLDYLIKHGPGWFSAAKLCQPNTSLHIVHCILKHANVAQLDKEALFHAMGQVPIEFVMPLTIAAANHIDVNELLLAVAKTGCVAAVEVLLDAYQADIHQLVKHRDIFSAQCSHHVSLVKFLMSRAEVNRPGKKARQLRWMLTFVWDGSFNVRGFPYIARLHALNLRCESEPRLQSKN